MSLESILKHANLGLILDFDGGLVEFFESEDVKDLAAKILTMMNEPDRTDALRVRGMNFVEQNNWDNKKHELSGLSGWPGAFAATPCLVMTLCRLH
ncbi:MAG TPA: hypothetical protein VK578_08765 [Edaphobacter sp.]|nr:hypothetical protein [Edaphobacter sp.]